MSHIPSNTPTITVRLPAKFANDYDGRICIGERGHAETIERNKRYWYVKMDRDTWEDMVADTEWYFDEWGCERSPENMPYIRSAQAAYKALIKAGIPAPNPNSLNIDRLVPSAAAIAEAQQQ